MRILVDMDGVMTDFNKLCWDKFEENHPHHLDSFPRPEVLTEFYAEDVYDDVWFKEKMQEIIGTPGFFRELKPIEGAVEALHDLNDHYQVFICTAPLLENPTCCDDKLWWIDKYLSGDWGKRTIITKDKTVVDGDILIDDKPVITGVAEEPLWQRVLYDQPYNKNVVGRRLNWQIDYKKVLESIW